VDIRNRWTSNREPVPVTKSSRADDPLSHPSRLHASARRTANFRSVPELPAPQLDVRADLSRAEPVRSESALDDTGYGGLVGRIMALVTEFIAPLHGEEGRRLGETSRRDLGERLMKIVKTIEAR
jgi:hypothetical protein